MLRILNSTSIIFNYIYVFKSLKSTFIKIYRQLISYSINFINFKSIIYHASYLDNLLEIIIEIVKPGRALIQKLLK